ncbi:UDP-N-acetylmuramate--L-alanine ligase [Patescibacteria group bacterium]
MDLKRIKKVYMIGIKGVGMTMLAQYLREKGIYVSGSDTSEKFMTDQVLGKAGIKVIETFDSKNIPDDADLIIYSSAYNKKTNPEVAKVISKENVLTYAQALGLIFNGQYGIGVIGSHGKTTTTAWLGYVVDKAGLSPSVLVGANVPQFSGTSLIGKSDYMISELDEYQNKLHYYHPKAIILNNIEYDHPDFFVSKEDYYNVFIDFIKKIPSNGFVVVNYDDSIIRKIINVNCRSRIITYALDEVADYIAYDIKQIDDPSSITGSKQYFKVKLGSSNFEENEIMENSTRIDVLGDFSIQLLGIHNIYNALAVIATSIELNIDLAKIRTYLEEFQGTERRTQLLGEYRGAKIIDDYAHHPTEIRTTLKGLKSAYPNNKIIVVFHPHTFTRTKALLDDFSASFNNADEVIVLDIYGSAREEQGGVHSKDLVAEIKKDNKKSKILYIPTLKEAENYLRKIIESNDVIILMGAGDVFRIGQNLIK